MAKNSAIKQLNLNNNIKYILFIAPSFKRFNKGGELFLQAIKLLNNKSNINVILKGHFSEQFAMKIVKEIGIKAIAIPFSEEIDEIAKLYSASSVCCVPSYYETFSLVTAEAMSCGTPVVAFDETGPASIIDHKINGYLAKSYETSDFANGINWILNNKNYSELCNKARSAIISKYNKKNIVDKYFQVYDYLMGLK